jgi:hypothetical protein
LHDALSIRHPGPDPGSRFSSNPPREGSGTPGQARGDDADTKNCHRTMTIA